MLSTISRLRVFPASAGMIPKPVGNKTPQRVFPASAGMIPLKEYEQIVQYGVPRIRGDDPCRLTNLSVGLPCSPHPRG